MTKSHSETVPKETHSYPMREFLARFIDVAEEIPLFELMAAFADMELAANEIERLSRELAQERCKLDIADRVGNRLMPAVMTDRTTFAEILKIATGESRGWSDWDRVAEIVRRAFSAETGERS